MTHRSTRLVVGLLLTLALVGSSCGDDGGGTDTDVGAPSDETTTSSSSSTSSTVETALPEGEEPRTDIELVCTGGPFTPEALESNGDVEDGVETTDATEVGATLRQLLADVEATGRDVPDRSWRELSIVTTTDGTIHELAHGSPPDMWVATVQQLGDGDRWQGEFVEPCTPRPYVDGQLVGYWWPADETALATDTTEVAVLVQEDSCDSGRGPDGRVGEPQITYGADVVVVTFPVAPRDEGGVFTCQAHPPAAVVIQLDEPIGDRVLLDGSTWPAHEPSPDGAAAGD